MRYLISLCAALLLATSVFTGCQSSSATQETGKKQTPAAPPAAQNGDDIKRMSIEDTRAAVAKGTAVIIDVRSATDYKANHIKGSTNIPYAEIADRMSELPKDKTAVLYCS